MCIVPKWEAFCDHCGWSYEALNYAEAQDQATLHELEHGAAA